VLAAPHGGHESTDSPPIVCRADLVVDASGRDSRAPRWLQALGYQPPAETVVNSFLGYASRYYHRPPDQPWPWKAAIVQRARPRGTRSGVLAPLEGDRWILTLAGAARDYPPNDEEGFLRFARELQHPILHDVAKELTPASPIWSYRRTENRLRHYDRLARRPERFVVLGDAACAFNPAYGQGMTVAATHAATLHRCLRAQRAARSDGSLSGFARRFQRELANDLRVPWLMATGEDFRHPATEGPRPGPSSRVSHWYFDRVIERANSDVVVHHAFLEVVHLLRAPRILLRPDMLLRVLGPWGRRGVSAGPPPPPESRRGGSPP
jgi:2-polyprenyl-6-methoxyphenol hydroxylase-like FAD-dependent oxidoreductase